MISAQYTIDADSGLRRAIVSLHDDARIVVNHYRRHTHLNKWVLDRTCTPDRTFSCSARSGDVDRQRAAASRWRSAIMARVVQRCSSLTPEDLGTLSRRKEQERLEKLRRRRSRSHPSPVASRASGITIHRVPTRSVTWIRADRRTVVATARRYKSAGMPVTYLLRVPGYQWTVTPDMPTARIWKIGGLIPTKGFRTWQECDREVARILGERT